MNKTIMFTLLSVFVLVIAACARESPTPGVPEPSAPIETAPEQVGTLIGELPPPPPVPGAEQGDLAGKAIAPIAAGECSNYKLPSDVQAAVGCTVADPNVDLGVVNPATTKAAKAFVKIDGVTPVVSTLPEILVFPPACTPLPPAGTKCYDKLPADADRDLVDYSIAISPVIGQEHYYLYKYGYILDHKNAGWVQFEFDWTGGPATTVFDDAASNAAWLQLDAAPGVEVLPKVSDAAKFRRVDGTNVDFSFPASGNTLEIEGGIVLAWVCSCDDADSTKQCETQSTWECNSPTGAVRGLSNGKYVASFYGEREANVGSVPAAPQ